LIFSGLSKAHRGRFLRHFLSIQKVTRPRGRDPAYAMPQGIWQTPYSSRNCKLTILGRL